MQPVTTLLGSCPVAPVPEVGRALLRELLVHGTLRSRGRTVVTWVSLRAGGCGCGLKSEFLLGLRRQQWSLSHQPGFGPLEGAALPQEGETHPESGDQGAWSGLAGGRQTGGSGLGWCPTLPDWVQSALSDDRVNPQVSEVSQLPMAVGQCAPFLKRPLCFSLTFCAQPVCVSLLKTWVRVRLDAILGRGRGACTGGLVSVSAQARQRLEKTVEEAGQDGSVTDEIDQGWVK